MEQTQDHFALLEGETYMSLKTFRKSGAGVPTPVWFAREGQRLFVMTMDNSGKVKRIRHTPGVEVTPCDVRGNVHGTDYIPAQARIISDPAEAKHANTLLNRKYSWQKRLFDLLGRFRRNGTYIYLEITPQ